MDTQAGLWIDHSEAVVVVLREEEVASITRIPSYVEKDHLLAGGSRSATPYGPQDTAPEQQFEEQRMHQLNRFFDEVTTSFAGLSSFLSWVPAKENVSSSDTSGSPKK